MVSNLQFVSLTAIATWLLLLFTSIVSSPANPYSSEILRASHENSAFISSFGADCFISSWITTSSVSDPICTESALVHDCMPERFRSTDPLLPRLRRRWLNGARMLLAVSRDTSSDLANICQLPPLTINWTHPAPDPKFPNYTTSKISNLFGIGFRLTIHFHPILYCFLLQVLWVLTKIRSLSLLLSCLLVSNTCHWLYVVYLPIFVFHS